MTDNLRNFGLIGHGASGKTSLAEAVLFSAGVTTRLGSVDEGNSVLDFEPEELKRKATICAAFHQYTWKKHTVYLTDTPGDQNFFAETRNVLQGVDAAVVVVDAVDGVKVQTEQAWDVSGQLGLPRVIFINRLDRERADFLRTVEDVAQCFEPKPVVLQLPIGAEADFKGVVDLLTQKAYTYENGKATETDIPADMADEVESRREALIEDLAEADDTLLERYLEGESLSDEEMRMALRKGTREGAFAPVICGSATRMIGVDRFMDLVNEVLPSPADRPPKEGVDPASGEPVSREPSEDAPFSGLVIKTMADPYAGKLTVFRVFSGKLSADGTVYNANKEVKERYGQLLSILGKEQKPAGEAGPGAVVAVAKLKETSTNDTLCDESAKIRFEPLPLPNPLISFAIAPKAKGDEEKIFSSLAKIIEEDPSLRLTRNQDTKETLLSGMGSVHVETAVERMKRKYGLNVVLSTPKVPYRETITKKVRVQGKHKKQTGGHGQYGDCWVVFEPLPRGAGFEFVDAIVGGVIPKTYIPAVEKGILESAQKGVLAGYPTVDFKATLDFGSFHSVDSSEMAFKIAGSLAFKKGMAEARPVLLEPIQKMEITVPDDFTGDVMGDLNSRRGRVLGMDNKGKNQVITAQVPLAEILTYASDLNSMTGGRGIYEMEFSHYDEVPAQIAQKIIEAAKSEEE
ncbi:MAG: elongation factor G [Deltaproteobacteria bacterium]|nr:elongation factor G [Deltaproteobacteria bacterium]